MTMTASPTLVRVDMTDALRLPNGFESPAPKPLVLFVRAPASWLSKGALTDAARRTLLAHLYGGPNWEQGNEDGSTYVVKTFTAKVVQATEPLADVPGAYWYEVRADGTLEKKAPLFGAPGAPKKPESLINSALPGSVFKQGVSLSDARAAEAWLAKQAGLVKLPVTLQRGQVGFVGRGAKAGAVPLRCEDSTPGVSLADRAREQCGAAQTCELWLIGYWRKDADGFVLDVTKVAGSISGAERELGVAGHAWFQAE